MIILIIIALALLCIYISFLRSFPIGFAFFGVMVGCLVATLIICGIIGGRKFSPSDWQKKQLDEAAERDKQFSEKNKQLHKAEIAKVKKQASEKISGYEATISDLRKKLSEHRTALLELDVLGPDELKPDIIDHLIQLIESHRADSIPEALRLYDEKLAQKAAHDQQVRIATFQAQLAHMEQQRQAQENYNRYVEDLAHKSRIEELEKKQLDELERMRKNDEYYRRYGQQL